MSAIFVHRSPSYGPALCVIVNPGKAKCFLKINLFKISEHIIDQCFGDDGPTLYWNRLNLRRLAGQVCIVLRLTVPATLTP